MTHLGRILGAGSLKLQPTRQHCSVELSTMTEAPVDETSLVLCEGLDEHSPVFVLFPCCCRLFLCSLSGPDGTAFSTTTIAPRPE